MLKNLISISLCVVFTIIITMVISYGYPKIQTIIFPKTSIYEPRVNNKAYNWTGPSVVIISILVRFFTANCLFHLIPLSHQNLPEKAQYHQLFWFADLNQGYCLSERKRRIFHRILM